MMLTSVWVTILTKGKVIFELHLENSLQQTSSEDAPQTVQEHLYLFSLSGSMSLMST